MRRAEVSPRVTETGERFPSPDCGPTRNPTGFVLYSRRYCHLCDEMLAALRAQVGLETEITVVDVDSNPALEARYGEDVPVLMCGSTEVCRHRYDAEKVAAYLAHSR